MGILSTIVQSAARHVALFKSQITQRRAIGTKLVSHNGFGRNALLSQQFPNQLPGCALVPPRLDKDFENLAFTSRAFACIMGAIGA
jgi:hypothetical protein